MTSPKAKKTSKAPKPKRPLLPVHLELVLECVRMEGSDIPPTLHLTVSGTRPSEKPARRKTVLVTSLPLNVMLTGVATSVFEDPSQAPANRVRIARSRKGIHAESSYEPLRTELARLGSVLREQANLSHAPRLIRAPLVVDALRLAILYGTEKELEPVVKWAQGVLSAYKASHVGFPQSSESVKLALLELPGFVDRVVRHHWPTAPVATADPIVTKLANELANKLQKKGLRRSRGIFRDTSLFKGIAYDGPPESRIAFDLVYGAFTSPACAPFVPRIYDLVAAMSAVERAIRPLLKPYTYDHEKLTRAGLRAVGADPSKLFKFIAKWVSEAKQSPRVLAGS